MRIQHDKLQERNLHISIESNTMPYSVHILQSIQQGAGFWQKHWMELALRTIGN